MLQDKRLIKLSIYIVCIVSFMGLVELMRTIYPVKVTSLSGKATHVESWVETQRDSRISQIKYQTGYLTFYLDGDFRHKFIYQLNIGGRITTGTLDYLKRNIVSAPMIEIRFDERTSRDSEIHVFEFYINSKELLPKRKNSYQPYYILGVILFFASGGILLWYYKLRRSI